MGRATLDDKLSLRGHDNSVATWTLRRWPSGYQERGQNRLFVASAGAWRGYFVLATDALVNFDDPAAPYTLLFDTRTWTPVRPTKAKPFRGFTYQVPSVGERDGDPTDAIEDGVAREGLDA